LREAPLDRVSPPPLAMVLSPRRHCWPVASAGLWVLSPHPAPGATGMPPSVGRRGGWWCSKQRAKCFATCRWNEFLGRCAGAAG
jgi:hypothetical protein